MMTRTSFLTLNGNWAEDCHLELLARRFVVGAVLLACSLISGSPVVADEYLTGKKWEEPTIVDPGETDAAPPSDAVVLFNGKDLDNWNNGENWKVIDGVMVSGKGMVSTKQKFGDCQLHLEWKAPTPVKGSGQGRGNSGVFLMGKYEMQILDSYDNKTYFDGQAAAIYKQTPPMVNAMRKPTEWNTYDIIWTAPRFNEDGSLESPAYITALHNGVLVLHHFEVLGDTPYNRPPEYNPHEEVGPIALQDHGNPVSFRNIWVRPIKRPVGEQVREPYIRRGDLEIPLDEALGN